MASKTLLALILLGLLVCSTDAKPMINEEGSFGDRRALLPRYRGGGIQGGDRGGAAVGGGGEAGKKGLERGASNGLFPLYHRGGGAQGGDGGFGRRGGAAVGGGAANGRLP